MTRITVVFLAALGPIYFFLLMFMLPFQMAPFDDPVLNWLFHHVAAPAVFSAAWVGAMYYERYRLANAVQIMHDTTTTVPLRWRVFYGANAAFVLTFFILPLATAPMALAGGLFVAGHVFYRVGVGKMGGGRPAAALGVLVGIALCILPFIIMIQFTPAYLQVWQTILDAWSTYWVGIVYGVAQCLVNALSFGAPFYFLFFAAGQYDKGLYGEVYTRTPSALIRIFETVCFVILIVFYLPPMPTPFGIIPFLDMPWLFTNYVNWFSLFIVAFMVVLRWRLKANDNGTIGGPSNTVVVGMFLLVEIFFKTSILIVTLIIWLAFFIFAGVILTSLLRASPREMY
ncbi:MAG: hypothetical protein C4K47_00210 [Candidatus Thorarchaeota archaeon]|nr:MAG: hypothetical protein C4K47_00210 [Candidatus Thorarchaeota archaeon]